jgi:beta-N-acetylhexosaminidase|tara:strand:- start:4912 stop:5994 length:1083 start_codon:yes stop_codon:yes gene_type:complete
VGKAEPSDDLDDPEIHLSPQGRPKAVIFGCSGPALTADERRFFEQANPTGFILFERNCQDPDQVRGLVGELRETVNSPQTPMLIDQEGGRVQRLKPPHWRDAPPPGAFAALAGRNISRAEEAVRLNGQLIAAELSGLGITVNCAPVLDIPGPDSHGIIGDRAFGNDPEIVAALGMAAAAGHFQGGVIPVIKHIPGHGRAKADSHEELPVVDAGTEELTETDFSPFRALSRLPWAMTAHVVYTALDGENPATTSAEVISRTIRGDIGFKGVLVSDDIGMKALGGSFEERTKAVLAAGCDLVLHCSGDMAEMEAAAAGAGPLTDEGLARLQNGESMRKGPRYIDAPRVKARLDEIMNAEAGA